MVNKNVRSIEIGPNVFRTFRVIDNWGTRSFKTFTEAATYMKYNKEKWDTTELSWRQGEEYGYQIRVIDESILIIDGEHINDIPEW